MAGRRSALATDLIAYGMAFTKEPTWLNELTAVTVGASTDMSDVAQREALSAEPQLSGPGRRLRASASCWRRVRRSCWRAPSCGRCAGSPPQRDAWPKETSHLPHVKASGPREVADTIAAVDEMTSVFSAVEAFTVTLAEDPDAPSLDVPLPGRTGRALQTTLNRLRESVRHAERQRVILHEMATHDSLTGLLNRQAARAAMRPRTRPGTSRRRHRDDALRRPRQPENHQRQLRTPGR